MPANARRIALATLLGVLVFLSKVILPSPLDKMFILPQALLLALGGLLLRRMGATYVATIGGAVTAMWRPEFALFTFGFAVLYGFFVDLFIFTFKADAAKGDMKPRGVVIAITLSTALIGILSFYTSVLFGLLPRNPPVEVVILIAGTLNGAVAGYLAYIIWKRYLKNIKF